MARRLATGLGAAVGTVCACSADGFGDRVGVVKIDPGHVSRIALGCTARTLVRIGTRSAACVGSCAGDPYAGARVVGASCSGGACELVEDEGGAFGDESARVVDIRALRAGPTRLTVHARSAENEDWYGSADVTFIDPSRVVLAPDPYSVWREGLGVVTGATIQWMTVESFLGDDLSPLTCSDREGIRAAMQPPLLTATRYPGKALDLRADAPGVSVVDVAIGSASQHLEVRVVSPEEIVGGSLHRLRRAEFPRTIPVAIDSATVDTLKLGVLGEAYLVPVWAARDGVSAVGGAGNFVSDSPHVVLDVPKAAAGSSASSNSVFIVHAVSVGRATLRGRLGQTSVELTIDVVDAPP